MKTNVIKLNILHLNTVRINGRVEMQGVSLQAGEIPEPPVVTTYTLAANVSNGKVTATKNGTAISLPYVATEGDVIVLSVTSDEGYEFNGWLDGNKSNPRTVTMTGNVVLSASCVEIAKPTYTLSASVTNGKVSATLNGSAVNLPYIANEGDTIVVEVTPNDGYTFEGWADGNTDNPRSITMTADVVLSAQCVEVVADIPSEYRELVGLYATSPNTYISLDEPIDSHSNYDLYFGQYNRLNDSNTVLFGIRRASGLSDIYANCIYFKNFSTWSPYAWVSGGVDSQLTASGYGLPFNGNKHKLSQRGGSLYEWDRLICHRDQDFTNPDGVPAFFGNLAKSKTSAYTGNASFAIFYRFVVFNADGTTKRDFYPVERISDNMKGVYDVVNRTFNEAKGVWDEWQQSDIPSITIEAQVAKGNPATTSTLQSANYYKGYWISCHDGQKQFTITKGRITSNDGNNLIYPFQQVLTCEVHNSNWHGNSSWLSSEKWSEEDFFPLLYVSTDRDNKLLAVYRIKGSNPDALEGIELVQKITIESSLYYNNFYGMEGANTFVHYGYTQNSYSSNENGNTILLRVYPLPNPRQGDLLITENDALSDSFDIGFASAGGDGYWSGKFFGMPSQSNNGEFKIFCISDDNKRMTLVYHMMGLTTRGTNYLSGAEIESIKYSPSAKKWIYTNEPISSGRLNFIDYDLWNEYIEIKQW